MRANVDFLMVYPHDIEAPSQRVLLGTLDQAGFSVHLLVVASIDGIRNDRTLRNAFLEIIDKSRIIGFSFASTGYLKALYLTKLIKSNFRKHIIWGGVHPTISYRNLTGCADAVFVGESDLTLPKYVDAIINGKPYNHIPNIAIEGNPLLPPDDKFFVNDLDSLPMPFYRKDGQSLILHDRIEDEPEYFHNRLRKLLIMTSRGCPYKCTYCANSYLSNYVSSGVRRIRRHSVNYIIRLIQHCRDGYDFRQVNILDDLFLIRKNEELEEFVERYNREIGLPVVVAGITPSYLTEEKMTILRKLPLVYLRVGIQTVSEKGLALYKRGVANRGIERAVKCVKKIAHGVQVLYDVILDNPYETTEDYIKTLRFVAGLPKPHLLVLYHLTLYEGTELRSKAIADNIIQEDDIEYALHSYKTLNDTYVNTLFRLLRSTRGFIPEGLVVLLTSRRILMIPWLENFIKGLIDMLTMLLERGLAEMFVDRLMNFTLGKYDSAWLKKRFSK